MAKQLLWRVGITLTLLIFVGYTVAQRSKPLPDDVLAMIEEWAPLIWLHPEDVYFPSSVDFFFERAEVRDQNETVLQVTPDRYSILTGPETSTMHLNTIPDLDCAECILDWFAGQNVTEMLVPTYVFVRDYNDSCGTYDVAYRAFYPFNYGKDVCIGDTEGENCTGILQVFGNHVGEWEHYTIRIRNGKVQSCYLSVHDFGAAYDWNDTTNNFQLVEGQNSKIPFLNVTYPPTVEVVDGFHAEVFSANGSHGLWAQNGTHEFVNVLFIHLKDVADRGFAWRTWDWLEIVNYDPDEIHVGEEHYLDYRGIWGNLKRGCEVVEPVAGECILVNGPGFWMQGPTDFPDDCPAS